MDMAVLSLNCQKNYNPHLIPFLETVLKKGKYDLFLLQEATSDVLKPFESFPNYSIINSKDKLGRLSLSCVVYNSKRCSLNNFVYEPILLNGFEKQELKKPFQSFGIAIVLLDFQGIMITAGSIHLPSGFSSKRRVKDLKLGKEMMGDIGDSQIKFYGGDCNFCFSSEIRRASKVISPEYRCITSHLGPTLNSYFTESHLPYSWVYVNNILRKLGIKVKLKTDHIFVDEMTTKRNNIETRILSDRVSDHSPIEMILKI